MLVFPVVQASLHVQLFSGVEVNACATNVTWKRGIYSFQASKRITEHGLEHFASSCLYTQVVPIAIGGCPFFFNYASLSID